MSYDAASTGRRTSSLTPSRYDADGVAGFGRRARMAAVARDMIRNAPFAARAQQVISANVVGAGIIPKLAGLPPDLAAQGLQLIEQHLDTTAIDLDGRLNLYGLQRLVINTVVDSGEALVVRHVDTSSGNHLMNLQLQVLEPDHLDSTRDGTFRDGSRVHQGIQYGPDGKRQGYWLYNDHPGAIGGRGGVIGQESVFNPAENVAHIYRQDRPGQQRGVSWFAPVLMPLSDLADYQDASLMRQKIASCFTAFRTRQDGGPATDAEELGETLSPGLIQELSPGEEIVFADPPSVAEFDPFTKTILRSVAAGMGITYEALTGDLSGVNFSSARMGRMEMDRNVEAWQWNVLIPQMMHPVGRWFQQSWSAASPALLSSTKIPQIMSSRVEWVPPHRILVDPAREISALRDAVRAGFTSRSGVQRQLGFDPERLLEEQVADRKQAARLGLVFDSDAAAVSLSGVAQPETDTNDEEVNADE